MHFNQTLGQRERSQEGKNLYLQCPDCVEGAEGGRIRFKKNNNNLGESSEIHSKEKEKEGRKEEEDDKSLGRRQGFSYVEV